MQFTEPKGGRMKKIILRILFALIVTMTALFLFALLVPTEKFESDIVGFEPIKSDELALKFAPVLLADMAYGAPTELLYRASVDEAGNTYIAYHVVWAGESNPNEGVLPFLNRLIYTGGLKLQKTMFGKGDVEVIEMMLSPEEELIRVQYETAENYDSKAFSVSHAPVILEGEPLKQLLTQTQGKLIFRVISWNHLFDVERSKVESAPVESAPENNSVVSTSVYQLFELNPSYFTESKWQAFEMFKATNTRLKKNRAHFEYEREFVHE